MESASGKDEVWFLDLDRSTFASENIVAITLENASRVFQVLTLSPQRDTGAGLYVAIHPALAGK